MKKLLDISDRFASLNIEEVFTNVIRLGIVQDYIIELNTEEQLYEQGINSEGKKLRSDFGQFGNVYAPFTIAIKREKGQPIDRVTLKDTGEFYDSFRVTVGSGFFVITANAIKENEDLVEIWGKIIGLTPESLTKLAQFMRPYIVKQLKHVG